MILATERWPGVFELKLPFDRELNAWIKSGLGYHFDMHKKLNLKRKAWYIGKERLEPLAAYAEGRGWDVAVASQAATYPVSSLELPTDLMSWQTTGILRALGDRVALWQWCTGAGKSRAAIELAKAMGQAKVLIVAPKMVLSTWTNEQLPKWYAAPDAPAPEAWFVLNNGRKTPDEQPEIALCSYGSLHKIPANWSFDLIVYDELHYALHKTSTRSKACVNLSIKHEKALRVGLTATPISSEIYNIHSQLNVLCPHRYGTFRQWWTRYHEAIDVGFEDHQKPGPLKENMLPDLLDKLNSICHYVGHEQVGNALPPISWNRTELGGLVAPRLSAPANVLAWRTEQLANTERRATAVLAAVASNRLRIPQGRNTAIICYHRALAEQLAEQLDGVYISGDLLPKARHAALANATLIVATMRSITEGLDLRRFTNVLIAEAYPVPMYLTQVLGRFVRLFATNPVDITFLQLRGSSDDVVIHRLIARMTEKDRLMKSGKVEDGLKSLLTCDIDSDDFLQTVAKELDVADEDDHTLGEDSWDQWSEDWE